MIGTGMALPITDQVKADIADIPSISRANGKAPRSSKIGTIASSMTATGSGSGKASTHSLIDSRMPLPTFES